MARAGTWSGTPCPTTEKKPAPSAASRTCAYSNRRDGSSDPLPPPVSVEAATERRKGEMSIGTALSGATRCVHRGPPMEGDRAFSQANDRASALNSEQSAGARAPHPPPSRFSLLNRAPSGTRAYVYHTHVPPSHPVEGRSRPNLCPPTFDRWWSNSY